MPKNTISNPQSTKKQKPGKTITKAVSSSIPKFQFRKSNLLLVPVATLVAFGVFSLIGTLQSYWSWTQPLSALLLVVFCLLYMYRVFTRSVNLYAQVIASIFSAILALASLFLLSGAGQTCAGLFGVQESCINTHYFTVAVLLFNPISIIIWILLLISGIIASFFGSKK